MREVILRVVVTVFHAFVVVTLLAGLRQVLQFIGVWP